MTDHLPSHRARVAQPRSEVIPEGDGVPSTHTHPTATQHRAVTTNTSNGGPLPFAAPSPIAAAPAVISMSAIVLTATTIAVLTVYTGHPHRLLMLAVVLGVVGVECLVIALAGLVRGPR